MVNHHWWSISARFLPERSSEKSLLDTVDSTVKRAIKNCGSYIDFKSVFDAKTPVFAARHPRNLTTPWEPANFLASPLILRSLDVSDFLVVLGSGRTSKLWLSKLNRFFISTTSPMSFQLDETLNLLTGEKAWSSTLMNFTMLSLKLIWTELIIYGHRWPNGEQARSSEKWTSKNETRIKANVGK